jgi:hypothetical protein
VTPSLGKPNRVVVDGTPDTGAAKMGYLGPGGSSGTQPPANNQNPRPGRPSGTAIDG